MARNSTGLSQPAYEYILHMIMTKKLMPGEKIPEQRIAQELSISRSPVREAMLRLSNEGLITIFPNRFAQVASYDEKIMCDIGTLRVALDSLSIKLAFLCGSLVDYLNLKDIAENCSQALEQKDYVMRRKYDCDFHLELAKLSRNDQLIKIQSQLYLQVQFLILHHPDILKYNPTHIQQHFEIAEALINRDEAKALSLTFDHLTSFYDLRSKYPTDFFGTGSLFPL